MQNQKSISLQIVQSNPKKPDELQFRATEKEFENFLVHGGYIKKPNNLNNIIPGGTSFEESKESSQRNYCIVAIMGPQSSGKSTILNKVFACKFDVLKASLGRKQTTSGIWLGTAPKARDLIIMDLEGTDSAQREKNRENFERQTSLMALALSEVLIINIGYQDLGRNAAFNRSTLKSIFEANLRLFKNKSKTLIIFLIRDQPEKPSDDDDDDEIETYTSPDTTKKHLKFELDNVWDKVKKPQAFKNYSWKDLMDVEFFFLPHFRFKKKLFKAKAVELYNRFVNKNDKNYYFNTSYHYSKSQPITGLYSWIKQLWNAIIKDEKLNIPEQEKMLAQYKCQEMAVKCYTLFENNIKDIESRIKKEYIFELGKALDIIINEVLNFYDETGNQYDKLESNKIKLSLINRIENKFYQLLKDYQLEHIKAKTLDVFELELNKLLPNNNTCSNNFKANMEKAMEDARKIFSNKLDESLINTNNNKIKDKKLYWNNLEKDLKTCMIQYQLQQYNYLVNEFDIYVSKELTSKILTIFNKCDIDMWSRLSKLRIEFYGSLLHSKLLNKLDYLMYDNKNLKEKRNNLLLSIDKVILKQIKRFSDNFLDVLKEKFDLLFNETEEGLKRRWDVNDDVQNIFKNAKNETSKLFDLANEYILNGNNDLSIKAIKNILIEPEELQNIQNKFKKYCDSQYRNACDIIDRKKFGGGLWPTHPLQWLILLIFGWNEAWYLMSNPLILILVIFAGCIAFIGYQAHQLGLPVRSTVETVVKGFIKTLISFLQNIAENHQKSINNNRRKMRRNNITPDSDDTTESNNITPGMSNHHSGIEMTSSRNNVFR